MAQKPRILLTGGGTGGHIYPLIAVVKQLRRRLIEADIRYFGDPGKYYRYNLENSDIRAIRIVSSKLRRYFSPLNILDCCKFLIGLIQSFWKVYWFMPDVAFSKGGPGSLSVVLACRFYQIPIIVHESDAVPGLSNRIAARYARKIFLAFGAAKPFFENKTRAEIEVVGQPVREEILTEEPKDVARRIFDLDPQLPAVLILGGSQGSARINEFVLENLEILTVKFQIIHQVGLANYDDYKTQYEFIAKNLTPELKNKYKFLPYLDGASRNMRDALNAADLVVSRAGAGAIFEIAGKGLPAVLIPYPESANGHQQANAHEYQAAGAAQVLEEENLLPHIFAGVIEQILNNREFREKMSGAARAFYKPEAAGKIAAGILELMRMA